jgi:hypothetical protein
VQQPGVAAQRVEGRIGACQHWLLRLIGVLDFPILESPGGQNSFKFGDLRMSWLRGKDLKLRPLGYEPKTYFALSSPPLPAIPQK